MKQETVLKGIDYYTIRKPIVVIPAYNEAESLKQVIDDIQQHSGWDVVVIDDASDDGTMLVSQSAGVQVIPLAIRLGAWGAIQTGIRYALLSGYSHIITMDADGQHLAEEIPKLVQKMLEKKADIIIGACPLRGSTARHFAWNLFKYLTGLHYQDLTSGFRLYNEHALELFSSKQATLLEYQDIGVLLLAKSHGLKVREIDVLMKRRSNGKSKIYSSWFKVIYYMLVTIVLSICKRRFFTFKLSEFKGLRK